METEMANQPNQSTTGTNQDKTARRDPAQSSQPGQQGQGHKAADQHQQDTGSKQPGQQQGQQGHPPGMTQGDNPDRPAGGRKS